MSSISNKLAELGLQLPEVPKPVAAYVPAVRTGDVVFVSGQIPFESGELQAKGPVPSVVSIEEAKAAAAKCALNALAVVADQLGGDLDKVKRVIRLGIFVASDPGFADQAVVANGASELLVEIFGEVGRHARAAVGSIGLPLGATVMVEMLVEVG